MKTSYSRTEATDDVLIGVSEAARRLGVTPRTLHRWEGEKPPKIKSTRTPGGQRRYSMAEIERVKAGRPAEDSNPQPSDPVASAEVVGS